MFLLSQDHSLVAKTLMSVGNTYGKLNKLGKGEEAFRRGVRIFKFTCGDYTPLTANAMHSLAKNLFLQNTDDKNKEANALLRNALVLYCNFDALSV